jgi:ABC-type polysaccharide/polyol phosphate transport system ATPase subunit
MVSIRANNVRLDYPVQEKLSLRPGSKRSTHTGGAISGGRSHRIVTALNGVSFELEAGDRLGLVGRNGAGKTTLLKIVFGIYEPTAGSVSIDGRVDALFNINLGFRPEATGRRNIVLRGLINGWTEEEIAERVEEIIEFSELGEFIDFPLKSYSQGMGARLAFSIATAMKPEILLMDEWISAGDADFRTKSQRRMHELTERAGIIVLASHSEELLQKTCNKWLELERGSMKGPVRETR